MKIEVFFSFIGSLYYVLTSFVDKLTLKLHGLPNQMDQDLFFSLLLITHDVSIFLSILYMEENQKEIIFCYHLA